MPRWHLNLGGDSISGAGGGTANVTVGEGGRLDVTGGIWIAHGSTLDPPPGQPLLKWCCPRRRQFVQQFLCEPNQPRRLGNGFWMG